MLTTIDIKLEIDKDKTPLKEGELASSRIENIDFSPIEKLIKEFENKYTYEVFQEYGIVYPNKKDITIYTIDWIDSSFSLKIVMDVKKLDKKVLNSFKELMKRLNIQSTILFSIKLDDN